MKTVGYMEGTNPELLTNIMLEGFETLPLSNGWDNHGKYIAHITRTDNIAVVVGYMHKFIPIAKEYSLGDDLLSSLKAYKIPVVFIVPGDRQAKAQKMVKGLGLNYKLSDAAGASKVVLGILKPRQAARKKGARKKR